MSGGKGNIKPEDGKQFSSTYQPDKEIWTEEIALKFCEDLLNWFKEDVKNIFYDEFIYLVAEPTDYHKKAHVYVGLPNYLAGKFTSCSNLLEKAKKIQEIKLYKYGASDDLNASMTKFILINDHGKLSEKTQSDHTTKGESINPEDRTKQMKDLLKRLDELNEKKK